MNEQHGHDGQHWQDQLPFYVAGTLSEAERAAVDQHLAGCAMCRARAADWQRIADAVRADALDRVQHTPPLNRSLTTFSNDSFIERTSEMSTRTFNPTAPQRRVRLSGLIGAAAMFTLAFAALMLLQSQAPKPIGVAVLAQLTTQPTLSMTAANTLTPTPTMPIISVHVSIGQTPCFSSEPIDRMPGAIPIPLGGNPPIATACSMLTMQPPALQTPINCGIITFNNDGNGHVEIHCSTPVLPPNTPPPAATLTPFFVLTAAPPSNLGSTIICGPSSVAGAATAMPYPYVLVDIGAAPDECHTFNLAFTREQLPGDVPANQRPLFGGIMMLREVAFDKGIIHTGDTISVSTLWEIGTQIQHDYDITLQLINGGGQILTEQHHLLTHIAFASPFERGIQQWKPDGINLNSFSITIPKEPQNQYILIVSVSDINQENGVRRRLKVSDGSHSFVIGAFYTQ